jgi:glycosyltransferase involved in cell wall biosynthesis
VSDLQSAGVEVLIRPLSVLRRAELSPRGLGVIAAGAARDAVMLRRLARDRQVAAVHSNTSVVLSGAAAAASARIPHVWHVREIYSRFGRVWPAYRRVLQGADALPCVSAATADQFTARARVIYDGLAIDPQRASRTEARAALGLPDDQPVIAVLGRISDWKGQDVLVRALAEPLLRDRRAIGVLAGEPWPGAEQRLVRVEDLAERLGVRDRLRLAGFRADVENVYGAADVVAVPSTEPDPLPGAAIEAAAAGCVVVASAHGGLPEIVRDRETGRLVRPGDPSDLARAVAELLDDRSWASQLAEAAAADVHRRFSAARMLDELQALYDELLVSR